MDSPGERAAAIDAFLDVLPPVPVLSVVPNPPALNPARRSALRAPLVEAQSRWPQLSLLDPDPVRYHGSDPDGVHYTIQGQISLSRAILARIHLVLP
jgi:hypothetical protein